MCSNVRWSNSPTSLTWSVMIARCRVVCSPSTVLWPLAKAIVPLRCGILAQRGVGQFLCTVADVQQITNPDLRLLGALPTLYDSRTIHTRDMLLDRSDCYVLPVLVTAHLATQCASSKPVRWARQWWLPGARLRQD